jgi:hypothetical protein
MKTRSSIVILCIALLSCTSDPSAPGDQPVTLSLSNAGTKPLLCRLMFGHWVDRDLGTLAPGDSTGLAMTQGKMMIETIQCAQSGDWMRSFGQVDFAPVRSRRVRAIEASCAAPAGEGRVACRLDRIDE